MITYKISRVYNKILLSITIFLIKNVWDVTKRNQDIIEDAKDRVLCLQKMIGTI